MTSRRARRLLPAVPARHATGVWSLLWEGAWPASWVDPSGATSSAAVGEAAQARAIRVGATDAIVADLDEQAGLRVLLLQRANLGGSVLWTSGRPRELQAGCQRGETRWRCRSRSARRRSASAGAASARLGRICSAALG